MLKAPLYSREGQPVGEVELPESVFGVTPKRHVLWEVVRAYLLNRRLGTHKAKTRGEVRGSGRKIWPQKGLGRARHGDRYAPIFVGGGKAFPPRPRKYGYEPPKKVRRLAMKMALSDRAREKRVLVIEDFAFEAPKTRQAVTLLQALGIAEKKALLISSDVNRNLYLSTRNLPRVETRTASEANTYDVLNAEYVVLDQRSIEKLKERLK